ncbi:MAG TPA: D-alanyl-D-alanine carboxypeptidase family protein [Thermoleophilaceae bacterium]|nr:D-alanyl-D-alanine carboxypeptidase family protein [Thermoleophilaceae bacterium]
MSFRSRTLAVAAALVAAAPSTASAMEPPPRVPTAQAAIVVDAVDGTVMFAKRPDAERSIASTTKLMTALLTLEEAKPRDVFTAPAYDAMPAESRINLREGERMTVQDLLEGLLLESANDAAVDLAENIAGSREAFVAQMNEKAEELGLDHTSYANPIGLDEEGNYSSARDLAALARTLLRNRRFARIVDSPRATLESGSHVRVVDNRNDLVAAYPWVNGVKTGYTTNAGNVLVGSAARGPRARVISVVMGEPTEAARDADTLTLLRWGLDRFRRVRVIPRGRTLARADVKYRDEQAPLVARRDVVVTVRSGEHLNRRVNAPDELEGPVESGQRVGSVTVLVDGRRVRRVALVTAEKVPGAGTLRVLLSELGVPLTVLIVLAILVAALLTLLRLRIRIRIAR